MPILSLEEKDLLNTFVDTQPALHKVGKILDKSGVPLGDIIALAASAVAVKFSWTPAQGGTGVVQLGKLPQGVIVTGVIVEELVASDAADVNVVVDAAVVVTALNMTALTGITRPTSVPARASAGVVTLNFVAPATTGSINFILQCVSV